MKRMRLAAIGTMAAVAIALAAPAQADDYDAPFNAQLHTFATHGPQDQTAWLAKISYQRMDKGVDTDAYKSAKFIQRNLALGTTEGQSFQFLGAAIDHYCPEHVGALQSVGTH